MADDEPLTITSPPVRAIVSSDNPCPKPGPPKPLKIPPPHESVFRYANNRGKKKINRNTCWRIIMRLLFSNVGLLVLVSVYSVLGAYAFMKLEGPAENEAIKRKKLRYLEMNDSIDYVARLLWFYQGQNMSRATWDGKVWMHIKQLEEYIIRSVDETKYDGNYDTWDTEWTFDNTLLFTISIITTIGYGNATPATPKAQIFCIFYAIVGIPLLLLFLSGIGDFMAKTFIYSYSRWCCHWCRIRRKKAEFRGQQLDFPVPRHVLQTVSKEKVGPEEYMPTERVIVPIVLNLVLLVGYIMLGAKIFSHWEGWNLVSAAYFTFITLTTIGFGDLTPGKSFSSGDDDDVKADNTDNMFRLLAACLYCALGLAILSMCIALMQEQVVRKIKNVGKNIGLVKETPEKESKK